VLPAPLQDQRRWLTPEPLNVAPQLVGLPLATPVRRALAMGLDLAFIALLSGVGGFWLVCGLVLVALLLRGRRSITRKRVAAGWVFAGVLALLAAQEAWDDWGPDRAVNQAKAAAERAADAADEDADDAKIEAAANGASAAASAPQLSDALRIAQLQAQIAELRKPRPFKWREQLERVTASVGVSFGWGIVYFSLLPAWWSGQTLGKKLFHLRIVELTGRPLSVMRCLRRYGGYAAGMATGGLGFLQALWDPNRQGIQDRVAHTVVVDLRGAPRAAP
jgi:uncharacterized RDD family membrane protein YckC